MRVMRYRLTALGWLGAAMFVLPTPIAAWEYWGTLQRFASRGAYQRQLEAIQNTIPVPEFSMAIFTALSTISLLGFVLLLVGREIVSD